VRAAIAHSFGHPLDLVDLPVPSPGPGQVLIEVIACGVCHSDVHAIDGDWDPPPTMPLVPGHEVTGRVVELGAESGGLQVGDLVGVPWLWSACGRCESCLAGRETICLAAEATGYSQPGGYADYVVAPAAFVGRLPESVDPYAIAPILCAGVTTYRGLKRSEARPGQWVTVLGVGGLGHLAVQYAVAMGLRVVAVDISDDKLALATSLGAELTVDARDPDGPASVHAAIGGTHTAVVTATAPSAFESSTRFLRPFGTAVFIGLPGGAADSIRTSISGIVNGEITVRGSNVGTRLDLAEAIEFAASGRVAAHTTVVDFADVNTALDDLRAGRVIGRTVLRLR
jgi:alcohol dehydrogenase, propanol-preferring